MDCGKRLKLLFFSVVEALIAGFLDQGLQPSAPQLHIQQTLDGLPEFPAGRTRVGYSTTQAAVQEFQVNTSNYAAEYGRAAGGVVNTVTRSGGNELHGQLFVYDRDSNWGATNPFTTIYPLDNPAWSLFYELVSNLLWALCLPFLSKNRLTLAVLCLAGMEAQDTLLRRYP